MLSPYGLDIIESCLTCKMRADRIFCDLDTAALQAFETIKYATAYPKGAVLFVEAFSSSAKVALSCPFVLRMGKLSSSKLPNRERSSASARQYPESPTS